MSKQKSVEELREGLKDPSRHVSSRAARLYLKSIERGVCVSCRKVPPVAGRRRCVKCATRYASGKNPYYHPNWRERKFKEGLCTACGTKPPRPGFRLCADCNKYRKDRLALSKPRNSELRKKRLVDIKRKTFEVYGGCICACCGETQFMFLSLDHINNDGAKHRRDIRSEMLCATNKGNLTRWFGGEKMYKWLARREFPDGFQVLCMNCNFGKQVNGGICPHKAAT